MNVADNVNITSDNIKGTADQGALKFAGKSTVAATKIGDGTKLNAVELNSAGTVNFSTTTNFDATTTTLNHADAVIQFGAAAIIKTDLLTTAGSKIIISDDTTITGKIGAAGNAFSELQVADNKTLTLNKDDSSLYHGHLMNF